MVSRKVKREVRKVEREKRIVHFKQTLLTLGFSSYRAYLASDLWKGIRDRVFERDNFTCQSCHKPAKVAHHRDYLDKSILGKDISKIVSLCHGCHKRVEFRITNGGKRTDYAAEIVCRNLIRRNTRKAKQEEEARIAYEKDRVKVLKQIEITKAKIAKLPKDARKCPRCQKKLPAEHFIDKIRGKFRRHCFRCRRELSGKTPPKKLIELTPQEKATPSAHSNKRGCVQCGHPIVGTNGYCLSCNGEKVRSKTIVKCLICGKEAKGSNFCQACKIQHNINET